MPTLNLDEDTLWYDVTGEGPSLVFVHGGWSHGEVWRPQIERFATDYRVLTLDLRGHGQTGTGDRQRYSIELFVDDLEQVFDHLDIERPVLCGLSLGAIVTQAYLDRHPEGVAGAILAGPARSMPAFELPSTVKPLVSPIPALAATLPVVGSRAAFRFLLGVSRATTGGPWLAVDPAVRSRALDVAGRIPPAEYRKIFAALYRFEPPELSHVPVPIHVIYGENESPLIKRQGKQILAAVEHGELTEIPDAGHLVNRDDPEAFNEACAEFLARLDGP